MNIRINALLAMSGLLVAAQHSQATLLLEETFETYTANTSLAGANSPTLGWTSAWATTKYSADGYNALYYTQDNSGNKGAQLTNVTGVAFAQASRGFTAGTLADGNEYWFSVNVDGWTTGNVGVSFGNGAFDPEKMNNMWLEGHNVAGDDAGFGFLLNNNDGSGDAGFGAKAIRTAYWGTDAKIQTDGGTTDILVGSGGDAEYVGKLNLVANGGNDSITLYQSNGLGGLVIVSTLTVDLDNTLIDTFTITGNEQNAYYDDIRLGTTLGDVSSLTIIPEPSTYAMLFALTSVMVRRRG
jgi:hypothetical protein